MTFQVSVTQHPSFCSTIPVLASILWDTSWSRIAAGVLGTTQSTGRKDKRLPLNGSTLFKQPSWKSHTKLSPWPHLAERELLLIRKNKRTDVGWNQPVPAMNR